MRSNVAILSALIVLLLVNWSIFSKEKHLKDGKVVYLQLAPVDPRSLMQGDYMALRFSLANEVYKALPKMKKNHSWRRNIDVGDGRVVVTLDENSVASFKRLQDDMPLESNEVLMRYRVRSGMLKFATNAFFFEEGTARDYQVARYGQFRVDNKGELLLTSMYDKNLKKIIPLKKIKK